MFGGLQASLEDLKAIRVAVPGCTINDVVLAICGGGLRYYLEHHHELQEEPLVAWVPINARERMRGNGGDGGNQVTAMTAPIYTDIEDPVERLQQVMAATQKSKAAQAGVSARVMTDLSKHVPAATQVLASRLVLRTMPSQRMCNLFISNVPGPQVPLYMNGALQVGQYGMAPLANGMGLFIAALSYNGTVSFNVTSTREILPDVQFFMSCLKRSLQALIRASKPVKKKRVRKKAVAKKTAKKLPKVNGERPAVRDDQSP
jgi:WS/DGAT/MGAT family acyltransferase